MFPTEPPITGKRKADDSNPLLSAAATAKRVKKDVRSFQFVLIEWKLIVGLHV